MGTINPGKKLLAEPTYPGVSEDFATTYRTQKAMPVDIWVAAHKSQYGFYYKYDRAKPYSPETFVDPEGFVDAVENLEAIYRVQLRQEAKEREAATGN
jgi:metallo-beta-lactamase class B